MSQRFSSLHILIILLLSAISVGSFLFLEIKKFENEVTEIFSAQMGIFLKEPPQKITLLFVGDIMLNRGVEWAVNKYGKGDFKFPFSEVAADLTEADILFGNLEGPISNKGKRVGSIYSFRMEPDSIEGLKFAGFDILSVANNHIFDYGREAMEDTFLRLKEAEIDYVGGGFNEKEAHSSVIQEIKGTKIAFLAYTNLGPESWGAKENQSGITTLTKENLEKDIKEVNKKADLVIVSSHFGEEYQSKSSYTQKFWAHLAIDSGADLVVGHHPHVVQEIEEYEGKYIAYSLGNFVFDQGFSEETTRGLMLKVVIEGSIIKEVIPITVQINQFFQPRLEINQ